MRILLLFFFAVLVVGDCTAQNPNLKRTWHWYFGQGAGSDFSGGMGVLDTSSSAYIDESCSAISDTLGNLLFYTNGDTIWNKFHQAMPNGHELMGCWSSSQGALIVPKPNDDDIYYVFTIRFGCCDSLTSLVYSVVDMTLNGGLGDITIKNVLLVSSVTEQVTGVHHYNGIDIWIVTHELGTNNFHTYLITNSGIDTTPVISTIGPIYPTYLSCVIAGTFKFSPNGKNFAIAGFDGSSFRTSSLFDFDNQTGIISNYVALPTNNRDYIAVSFSPDNSKLYFSSTPGFQPGKLIQYDLINPNPTAIIASKTEISSWFTYTGLQLSPDNKIYVIRFFEDTVGIIQNPNASGINCSYTNSGLSLNGRINSETFPNFIESYFYKDTLSSTRMLNKDYSKQVTLYPNPYKKSTKMEFKNPSAENHILIIYNSHGQNIWEIHTTENYIPIEKANLTNGLYFYQLCTEKEIIGIGKLIVSE